MKSNLPLISICITSYNRNLELERCLNSIDFNINISNDFEIVVSEDNSPEKNLIKEKVELYKKNNKNKILLFNSNDRNLGYDRNLKKLITLASGVYIIFISDDDCFIPGALDKVHNILLNNEEVCVFSPFICEGKYQRKYSESFKIEKGLLNASKFLYDGILFSGLIFKKDKISYISAEWCVNLNYFQIYLLLHCLCHYGAYYMNIPLINCVGDGENAYGKTELSGSNNLLANRESVLSNLEFHKGLVEVIKTFDQNNNCNIISFFEKEYSLRSYTGLTKARKEGREKLKIYWQKMNDLNIKISLKAYVYYFLLFLTNKKVCDCIFYFPKIVLSLLRRKTN